MLYEVVQCIAFSRILYRIFWRIHFIKKSDIVFLSKQVNRFLRKLNTTWFIF